MADTPLSSIEVRWFFEGPAREHEDLFRWLESIGVEEPEWRGRLDDQPDLYLALPGADDLGIKWREGEFQVKGRGAMLGLQCFAGRHRGHLDRWQKWCYRDLSKTWRSMFTRRSLAVSKSRAMQKFELDTFTGALQQVTVDSFIDRGLGVEVTDIEVQGQAWTSLGFEAFPDDSAMIGHFITAVDQLLASLEGVELDEEASLSYPAWLQTLIESDS